MVKGALGKGCLFLKRLTVEGVEGELLYCGSWVVKGRFWERTSFMGAQLSNLEWAYLPGTLRDGCKGLWRWGVSLYGSSVKRNWKENSLAGCPGG